MTKKLSFCNLLNTHRDAVTEIDFTLKAADLLCQNSLKSQLYFQIKVRLTMLQRFVGMYFV